MAQGHTQPRSANNSYLSSIETAAVYDKHAPNTKKRAGLLFVQRTYAIKTGRFSKAVIFSKLLLQVLQQLKSTTKRMHKT